MHSTIHWRVTSLVVVLASLLSAARLMAEPRRSGFKFEGTVSGFGTGALHLGGGGDWPALGLARSTGAFTCLADVSEGPLSVSRNPAHTSACSTGEGVRWDAMATLAGTTFTCTGDAGESLKTATTGKKTVVLQTDLYRAGDGGVASFTARMVVSATDIAPDIPGLQNLWVEGVGCGAAMVRFPEGSGRTDVAQAGAGSKNGAAGEMPAFYDGELFTVNIFELPETASESNIDRNQSVNEIYVTNDLDEHQEFIPVIDAIQGDGFNPLWRQVFIVFNDGFAPHQFFSDEEIEDAAAGANPEITLVDSDEMYRCAVVGGN